MISHFQFTERSKGLAGWNFSFFYKGKRLSGIYHRNGSIEWHGDGPSTDHEKLQSQIHELMLFHVYDKQ